MIGEYIVIILIILSILITFINFITRGLLKVYFANPYWITLANYIYFFIIYSYLEIMMFLNFFLFKWDETHSSRLSFNAMIFIIVYSLSVWLVSHYYNLFKSTQIYKFDIIINKKVKNLVLYIPIFNALLFAICYTWLCISKEMLNRKFNEIFI